MAQQQQALGGRHDGGYYDREGYWVPQRHHRGPHARPMDNRPPMMRPEPVVYLNPYERNPSYGKSFGAQQQQQHPPQQQPYGCADDMYYEDEPYYEDEYEARSYEEDDAYAQQQLQLQSQADENPYAAALKAKHAPYENLNADDLLKPANIKYDTINFEASRELRPRQLFAKDSLTSLKNGGKIIFSMENQHLKVIGGTCERDIPTDFKKRITTKNDLIESFKVTITSNFTKKLNLEFPGVTKIGREYFRDNAPHFVHTIPAGSLSESTPYTFTFKRKITVGQIAFAATYDSPSPDSMDATITPLKNGFSAVPFTHAIVHFYNKDHKNDGLAITEKSLNSILDGDVKMLTSDVKKYLDIAKGGIGQSVSLGNVTGDMVVVLSVPEPTDSIKLNTYLGSQNKPLKPFLAFADANYVLGRDASDQKKEKYLDSPLKFEINIDANYAKLDGREIEFIK